MRRIITLIIIALFLISDIAHAGWKENYRTRYSKKNIEPNSEKAERIRRLCNPDFKFLKWRKTPEERAAAGEEPKTTLSAHLMPWKRKGEEKDKFEGFTTNILPKIKDLPEKGQKVKSGYTLTDCIKMLGKTIEAKEAEMEEKTTEEVK